MTIATPAVPLLVIDGKLHLEIGSTRYRVEEEIGPNGYWVVRLHKENGTQYLLTHARYTTCDCKSFRFGRKLKGTNDRVYGSCKHTTAVAALVDVLRALRGETT